MKKTGLIIASLLIICLSVKAQEDSREKIQLGAKAGFNYSNVYDVKGEDFTADPRTGWVAGGFLSIPIGTYLGVQPEMLYSQKGFQGSGKVLGIDYEYRRTLNYIDVPLYISVKPIESITFLAGPQYSFLLRKKDEFHSDLVSEVSEQEFDNDNIRKNTLGVAMGIDINFDNVVIGARAAWDLQNNNGDGTSSKPNYKNTLLQATFGLKF